MKVLLALTGAAGMRQPSIRSSRQLFMFRPYLIPFGVFFSRTRRCGIVIWQSPPPPNRVIPPFK